MKNRDREGQGNREKIEGLRSINMKTKNEKLKDQKKMRGLSLEAFANAKSKRNRYNPSLISIKHHPLFSASFFFFFPSVILHVAADSTCSL